MAECRTMVAAGRRSNFRSDAGATGAGLAIGAGAAMVTAGSAASGAGMLAGPAAAAGLGIGLVMFAPIAIFGVTRAVRASKEREIKTALTTCLAEHGYAVEEWERVRPSPRKAAPSSSR